ncbi:MAG: GNAT family N-acetyltransferase [Coriobacteriia bacterium]|jgi:GNAT superfamily N-acetyltransferase|nr:GNAT family N-acetyltransferase [Coriobacteriia bacterium]
MGDSYRVVSALLEHVSVLPDIERGAAELFGDAVPAELSEHVTPASVFLAAQQDGTLWVALGPDELPVGFVRVVVTDARVHLAELDVLPAHGRRGVGTALVGAVEDWARSKHYEEITLTTYRDLPWNAPFYAGLGYRVVPESEWDSETRRRFEDEAGLKSELDKRVAMRKRFVAA